MATALMTAPPTINANHKPNLSRLRGRRDKLAGWRDGRRGLPLVVWPDTDSPVEPPGHLLTIRAEAGHRIDLLFRDLVTETSADRVEHSAAEPMRQMLSGRIAEFGLRLSRLLEDGPATDRRMGERDLPDNLILRRRHQEFERKVRYLRKQITESRNQLTALEVRQLELAEGMDIALITAQSDGRALATHAEGRAAEYLKGAGRTHPDPSALVASAPSLHWEPPSWLTFATALDLIDALKGEDL